MEIESLHIKKGSVKNVVDREMYEKNYKPLGWVIDSDYHEQVDEVQETIKSLRSEQEIKNYTKMKRANEKKFDDKLIKNEN